MKTKRTEFRKKETTMAAYINRNTRLSCCNKDDKVNRKKRGEDSDIHSVETRKLKQQSLEKRNHHGGVHQ
jgi:hypothetical protein